MMGVTRRGIMAILTVGVLAVSAACGGGGPGSAGGGSKSNVLRIAYQVIPNSGPIVKHEGWLKKKLNVRVKFHQFSSGSDVVRAIAAGDVDVGLVGSVGVATAVAQDLPVQTVWIYDVIYDAEALVARKGSGIKTVKDLKGKKVATPFGSTTQYALGKALQSAGMSTNSINLIDMKPNEIVAALKRGDIDAGYTWHPTLHQAMKGGAQVVFTSGDLIDKGVLTTDLGIASTDLVQNRPKVLQGWLRAQDRAVQMLNNNAAKASSIIADEFQLKKDVVKIMVGDYKYVPGKKQATQKYLGKPGASAPSGLASSLADTAKFLKKIKAINEAPSLSAFQKEVTPKPLTAAVKGGS